MTLPWDDNGYRVLPAAAYMDHTERMRQLSNRFTPAIDTLTQQFGQLVEEARVRLGGLFRSEDYPAPEELRSKFSFETKVMPLPDAGDFRVTLGDDEKERIKRQITAAVEASLQVASRELWQRLYEAVSHLAERLQAYKVTGDGIEHPFRDSVVTNLVKLVDVLPKLNVTGDPELERLAAEVRSSLLVDPQELRKSESVRSETAKAAAAIANRMEAYMSGYSIPAPQRRGGMKPAGHTTTAQKLTRSRVQLILKQPFFGTLSLRLKLIPGTLPTMATDGSRIVYNPAFVDELKPAELEGTLAHEVLHCALGHQCRRGQRDPELWNVAADFAINPILIGNGFVLPAGALVDPAFNNLSAEEIYARLLRRRSEGNGAPKPQQQQTNAGGGTDTGPHGTDGTMPSTPKPDPSHQPVSDQRRRDDG